MLLGHNQHTSFSTWIGSISKPLSVIIRLIHPVVISIHFGLPISLKLVRQGIRHTTPLIHHCVNTAPMLCNHPVLQVVNQRLDALRELQPPFSVCCACVCMRIMSMCTCNYTCIRACICTHTHTHTHINIKLQFTLVCECLCCERLPSFSCTHVCGAACMYLLEP
jgi:hypothetical protein